MYTDQTLLEYELPKIKMEYSVNSNLQKNTLLNSPIDPSKQNSRSCFAAGNKLIKKREGLASHNATYSEVRFQIIVTNWAIHLKKPYNLIERKNVTLTKN
jgi:hypothetical protein